MAEEEKALLPTSFLLKSLFVSFTAWAAVVAWGVDRVTTEMDKQGERQERAYLEFKNYVAFTEARLTKLEAEIRLRHMTQEVPHGN